MTFNWGEVKDDIERLYMKEGKSLKEVRKTLKDTRSFSACVRTYKDKLEEWGYRKYNTRRKVPAAASLDLAWDLRIEKCTQLASALLPGSDSAMVRKNLMQVKNELDRQAYCQASVTGDQRRILSKASRKRRRQVEGLNAEEVCNSPETMTKLAISISQKKNFIQQMLRPAGLRASGTIGFNLCWKHAPESYGCAAHLMVDINILIFRLLETMKDSLTPPSKGWASRTESEIDGGDITKLREWITFACREWGMMIGWILHNGVRTSIICKKCAIVLGVGQDVSVEYPYTDLEDLCDEPEDSPCRSKRVATRPLSVRLGSAKQSIPNSLIKHQREKNPLPRRAKSIEFNHGKLSSWQVKQAMEPTGFPEVNSDLMLSPSIFSLQCTQTQGFSEHSMPLIQSLPAPNLSDETEIMGTWTSTSNHLIDMGPHDQLDCSFYFNNSANEASSTLANYQTSEIPPLIDLPEWTSLNQYPAFGGNDMWYMPPDMNIVHDVTEQGLMQTGEDLTVGGMDLPNVIDFEPVDSGINWF